MVLPAAYGGVDPMQIDYSPQSSTSLIMNSANSGGYLKALETQARLSGDDVDLEKYLDALGQSEYANRAYEYDEYIRSSQYQRMSKDLKEAGLNPYLALNSLTGGSGSSMMGSVASYNSNATKSDRLTSQSNLVKAIAMMFAGVAGSAGAIAKLLAL